MRRPFDARTCKRCARDAEFRLNTDLFAVVSAVPTETVTDAIPPACRRTIDAHPAVVREGADALVDLGPWRPRSGGRHFVPALGVLAPAPFAFRFELSVMTAAGWSPWVATTSVGPAEFFPCAPVDGIESQIDLWTSKDSISEVRLRVRVRSRDVAALLDRPWLVTLSVCDGAEVRPSSVAPGRTARLPVPALSQMEADRAVASRICSPTSVAMVLGYLGAGVSPERLAAEMFHPALDLYGVWPAAVCAAGRRGVLGYLLRFPDWAAAAWCLDHGLPIVASLRYEAGELTGAAIAETTGHLVVLTGYDGDDALVNDPAAASASTVPRRYPRRELENVWLDRAGVGYVFFKAPDT